MGGTPWTGSMMDGALWAPPVAIVFLLKDGSPPCLRWANHASSPAHARRYPMSKRPRLHVRSDEFANAARMGMVADNLSLSLSAADAITRKLAGTEKKRKAQHVLVSELTMQTSFGPLMRTIDVPLDCEDGGPSSYKLLYIDPCGMLEEFCLRNPGFAELLCTSCPDGRFPLALYSDELCAGNPLKPDGTRMLQAI